MKEKLVAVLLASCVALTACSAGGSTQPVPDTSLQTDVVSLQDSGNGQAGSSLPRTVTVNSRESVHVEPDIAEIVYSVSTQAAQAADCQQQNSQEVDQLSSLLKEMGVAEASIQTTDYYMNPRYEWINDVRRLAGYEACTTLTVSDIPMAEAGTILAESVKAGVNHILSISYLSSRYDEAYRDALALAVSAAAAKAQSMADAAGYSLGRISYMQETSSYSQARYQDNVLMARELADTGEQDSITILPGELEIVAQVIVEYCLEGGLDENSGH